MAAASTEFGFVTAACVTCAGVGVVRNLLGALRLYSGKLLAVPGGGSAPPAGNGTVLAWPGTGGPVSSDEAPCTMTALPCGIVASRTTVAGWAGLVVAGTFTQTPGSVWRAPPVLLSLICCR